MASEGEDADRATEVASVASRLFGITIGTDAVIDESLERATDPSLKPAALGEKLKVAIDSELPESLDDDALRRHPLAVWIELEIGLEDGQRLSRRNPSRSRTLPKRQYEQDSADRKPVAARSCKTCSS